MCNVRLRSFYDKDAPIYTMSRFLPPSKVLRHSLSFSAKQETTISMIPILACASAAFQSILTASRSRARAMASAATSCTCTMAPFNCSERRDVRRAASGRRCWMRR